jgi:Domain of Unknown Function (DUF1259)
MRIIPLIATCGFAVCTASLADAQGIDWAKVDAALGRSPAAVAGGVHRYGFPRSDLQVTLDGVTIHPAFALGGWVAFEPMGNMAMVMGDLVLLQSEVNPVMAKLIDGGLEVTAVHNHLLRSEPLTFYMHVGGHGDPAKMAETIHEALAVSKTPLTVSLRTASRNRPRYRADRPDHRGKRRRQRRGLRDQCSAARRGRRAGNGGRCTHHGRRNRHQLPADRRR